MQNVDTYFLHLVLCGIWIDFKILPESRLGDHKTGGWAGSPADPDAGSSVLWLDDISGSGSDRAGNRFPGEAAGSEGYVRGRFRSAKAS